MPLSRELQVARTGRDNVAQGRLRAAAFDRCKPVTRRAAALGALFRAEWRRVARGRAAIWRSPPKATFAPGSWSSTSWRPSWRLRSSPRCSVRLKRPPFGRCRASTRDGRKPDSGGDLTVAASDKARRKERAVIAEQVGRSVMHMRTPEFKFRASWNGALPSATAGPSTSTVTIWERKGRPSTNSGSTG